MYSLEEFFLDKNFFSDSGDISVRTVATGENRVPGLGHPGFAPCEQCWSGDGVLGVFRCTRRGQFSSTCKILKVRARNDFPKFG